MGYSFTSAKIFKAIFTCLLINFLVSPVHGQGYLQPADVLYEAFPLQFKNSGGSSSCYGSNFMVNDIAPLVIKKDTSKYLVIGANFEWLHIGGNSGELPFTDVYSIAPVLGYYQRIGRHVYVCALAIPLLNTDFRNVAGGDIHAGGLIGASYRFSKNVIVRLKIGCDQQYFGTQYIALVGLDWKISDRWRAFGEFPIYATLAYSAGRRVNIGLNYAGISTSYGLAEQQHYLQYTTTQLGLFGEYYLTSHFAARSTAAYSLQRDIEIYSLTDKTTKGGIAYIDDGPQTTAIKPGFKNGLLFRLSLCLRIPQQ